MPYIKQDRREHFYDITDKIDDVVIQNEGELNYLLSLLCNRYINYQGKW